MWVGLVWSVEGIKRENQGFPERKKGVQSQDGDTETLFECPACQPGPNRFQPQNGATYSHPNVQLALKILDLPTPTITWASFLK